MSTKTQEPRIIELVKHKQWYVARDATTYQVLREIGVPILLIHRDFLNTLQLATKRHNVRARETDWSSIYDAMLDDVGTRWKAKEGRTCKLDFTKLTFLAKSNTKNREAVAKLEVALGKFFARWSFRYYPTFSEASGKLKLVVEFRFDPELQPLVPSVVAEPKTEYEMELGFTKFKLTFYDKPTEETKRRALIAPLVIVETFAKAGTEWAIVHTGTFTNSQIGNVDSFLTAMATLHGRQKLIT